MYFLERLGDMGPYTGSLLLQMMESDKERRADPMVASRFVRETCKSLADMVDMNDHTLGGGRAYFSMNHYGDELMWCFYG